MSLQKHRNSLNKYLKILWNFSPLSHHAFPVRPPPGHRGPEHGLGPQVFEGRERLPQERRRGQAMHQPTRRTQLEHPRRFQVLLP